MWVERVIVVEGENLEWKLEVEIYIRGVNFCCGVEGLRDILVRKCFGIEVI